jgi:hypothetical protein
MAAFVYKSDTLLRGELVFSSIMRTGMEIRFHNYRNYRNQRKGLFGVWLYFTILLGSAGEARTAYIHTYIEIIT